MDFIAGECPIQEENATIFDFGMYLQALQSDIVLPKNFLEKFFYCFWWGLQNLRYVERNALFIVVARCVFYNSVADSVLYWHGKA